MRSRTFLTLAVGFAAAAIAAAHIGCSASSGDEGFNGSKGGGGGASGKGGGPGAGGSAGGLILDSGLNDAELTADGACAADELQAEAVPLNLYFMLDTSLSMDKDWGQGKSIKGLRDGVINFLNDPASGGIIATAQHFPLFADPNDMLSEQCTPDPYATPPMPWSPIPYPQLGSWVGLLKPAGLTPTVAALEGAINACKARLTAEPNHKCAVILVTDGMPQGTCEPTGTAAEQPLGQLAADAYNDFGIATFVVGFPGIPAEGQSILNTMASNGGTKQPVVIQGGDIGQQFKDALNAIRGAALACEYKMPTLPAGKKSSNVTVRYTPGGGGTPQELPKKKDLAACGAEGGWYFDNEAAPTKIMLCPGSCAVVQTDATGKVEVLVLCHEVTY